MEINAKFVEYLNKIIKRIYQEIIVTNQICLEVCCVIDVILALAYF